MASRCPKCEMTFLPPRPLCPCCFEAKMEWQELKGKGKLSAFTVIYVAPTLMVAQGYGRANPYCVGIVELEEGPRISARLVGVDPKRPEEIKIGMPLTVDFLETGEGAEKKVSLAFKPY